MMWLPRLMGKRCIATIHGLDHQRSKWGRFARWYILRGEKCAVKRAHEIIVLSRNAQAYFKERYGRETTLIPNGMPRMSNRDAALICDKYGLHKDSYILFLGRLVPEKGIHYLIEAYKSLRTDKKLVIAGGISDSVLAAVGVCNKVMMFPFSIILGFGTGFQPVAGFNFGAKRFDRVHESYRFCAKVAFIGSLVMAIFVGVLADTFVVLFAGSDEEMRRIGVICMVSQCFALPVHAWVAIVNMLCAGLGNARGALILSTSRQGTCFLPILYPLAWVFGAFGIACVQAIADILSLVLAIPILRKTRKAVNEAEHQWLAQQKS